MSVYHLYHTGTGGFPRPGGAATDGAAYTTEAGWKVGVHLDGGGERGGEVWDDGNLHFTKAEYDCTLYCNTTDYGPVRGGREEAGGMGGDAQWSIGPPLLNKIYSPVLLTVYVQYCQLES